MMISKDSVIPGKGEVEELNIVVQSARAWAIFVNRD